MSKPKISENKLIKALQELEGAVEKGDALEEADPEGGLSTEGAPLSDAAPRGRGESTKKSRRPPPAASSGSSSSSAASSEDASSVSSMMSPKEPPAKKSKKKKEVRKAAASSNKSSAASSEDDSSDDRSEAEKSFRQMADGNETMRKAIIVNEFIEAMVDQISLAMHDMKKSVARRLGEMEERLNAAITTEITKSTTTQQGFNARLATAVAAIGNSVQDDLVTVVKSLSDMPVTPPRGKAVLSKGEVNQPPWSGPRIVNADQRLANGADDFTTELSEVPRESIENWLFKKSANNQVDPNVIIAWEADHYDVDTLPVQVRKALVNDLCK